ncbi:hypothetical protein COF81_13120 [Bacillus pseudomycoides]|uniref:Uncharacterized protein n=1 Tax=Bacillus pseudomycoides TaxID=64104 RepID=A0ABD6T688_9BACI|nr:hypothetical protein CON69_20245 [Bacillus pseudomycoides]PEJ22411.1 hypothetical protein CN887_22995 [Bacillus pseudomycoides]PHE96385.1 hypothetical protein COF81_13120 [Bacillus pseudomycoides]
MTSRSTPASLILDAFYVDEFGVQNASNNIASNMPRGNQLSGWPGGDGEENHDLFLPDFA